ncbi:ABC transporter permease subunit [Kineosporia sp. NBRC 101731]|uniref:ABC transporter permease subunit n=1 Tax=Kineosporia sp. NBRC 101731 TaxID=3032199 RepID=UPI0024A18E39|nr:ABC transporter permease subunit [Kineosporia sp. NBRC 101731]GLY31749.1 ABC transporter permease [Kineosporia sp. NBRC 101731]
MSTATPERTANPVRVTQSRVIASEWIKFRSLRSTVWTLVAAVGLLVGIAALFSAVMVSQWDTMDAGQRALFDPVTASAQGSTFAQLATGVLGVLLISGEYSTGMIRASLTVVPRRLPVLWGKIAVFAAVTFAVMLVASFGAFLVTQAVLAGQDLDVALGHDGVLRTIVGVPLYVTVAGIFAMALGTLLRNTAAGISALVAVFFVVPPLFSLLPSSLGDAVVKYLPNTAGQAVFGNGGDGSLAPWTGFGVFCVYTVVLVGIAAWRLRRVDV